MEPTISAEEFHRFQMQLLDLREAQISAHEHRLRAEARVKQLEDELAKSGKAHDYDNLDELLKENIALRDKLQSMESSFQLQSSTLRAECHHLATELSRLQDIRNKPCTSQSCQTLGGCFEDAIIQTELPLPENHVESDSSHEIINLRAALNASEATQSIYDLTLLTLKNKVSELENVIRDECVVLLNGTSELRNERDSLVDRVNYLERSLSSTEEHKQTLQNQLDAVRRRSEKVNRELRRQLARFVKVQHGDLEQGSLRKSPTFSSSSSLSSFPNGTMSSCDTPINKSYSCDHPDNIPPGYLSAEDFKALVNRMLEVQEENCTLRRQLQGLQAQLAGNPVRHSLTSGASVLSPGPQFVETPRSSDSGRSTFALFSMLKLPNFVQSHNAPICDAVSMGRLKHMCEDLITQNIKLSEELEALRGKK